MCVFVCFCLSKPFPTSIPFPLQPLSREVKARCTQTHPDAFNLSKWVTSVHMFRFLAWTKGKRLALYFGKKLRLLTFDPEVSSSVSQESLQACQCPEFFSPAALTTTGRCSCQQQTSLGHVDALSLLQQQGCGKGPAGRKAAGQGGKRPAGTEAWQTEGISSPWLGWTTLQGSCKD